MILEMFDILSIVISLLIKTLLFALYFWNTMIVYDDPDVFKKNDTGETFRRVTVCMWVILVVSTVIQPMLFTGHWTYQVYSLFRFIPIMGLSLLTAMDILKFIQKNNCKTKSNDDYKFLPLFYEPLIRRYSDGKNKLYSISLFCSIVTFTSINFLVGLVLDYGMYGKNYFFF